MVQEFHVVRCFTCQSFQVKKVNKWSCKLCGVKQSLLKEFGRGSGADCRRHVQKLNAMRGARMEEQEQQAWSLWEQVEAEGEGEEEYDQVSQTQVSQTQVSRWSKYLDTPEEAELEEEEEESVLMDRQQLHGINMTNRKRKRREGWTDGGKHSWTPEQPHCSSMKKPVRSSATNTSPNPTSLNHPRENHTRTTSLNHPRENHTRTISLNSPSLNHTSPSSKKSINPPSVRTGPVSRWAQFLSSDCQVEEEPSASGWSQTVVGAAPLSCNNTINEAPPFTRPRPLLPASSMFESGEDFSFDEF
ncbi:MRN complex-interacting protein isoform X2 [Epinephelus lanceolatus]|uniref:MRN complex-interacting protein isoform X2 n=1 Tax=Epinephelus lanceolatus TaxID=310571 RepID=UPI00144682CF|nr:MRN complex-interacting protein isoform X2 [Epinephelus lanceolatus]